MKTSAEVPEGEARESKEVFMVGSKFGPPERP
jgi:hypothetical protein